MNVTNQNTKSREGIHTFVRNRYFYGKLLDVVHFEMEQNYVNGKRWMLNRMVTGYGVLCGLDVTPSPDGTGVVVSSGAAIDRCGREIIVPRKTDPQTISPMPVCSDATKHAAGTCDCEQYVHLSICFKQCESDPSPVSVDACGTTTACSASAIQERYSIEITQGKIPEVDLTSSVPDFMLNGRLNYNALVESVTRECADVTGDCCIPLANIAVPQSGGAIQSTDIDIAIRPIVYTNDMLLDIMLAMSGDVPARSRGGKQ